MVDRLFDADGSRRALQREWYREGLYGEQTFPLAMAEGSRKYAGRRMVFYSGGRTTEYPIETLFARSRALAGALSAIGLEPGDVIGIQVPNWYEGYLMFQASMLAGLVVLPIVHIYGAAEVGYLLRESRAKALVVPDRWRSIDYLARLSDLENVPELRLQIVIGDDVPSRAISWNALNERANDLFQSPTLSPDDVALMLFTSGTTSNPKGVLHSHNSLLAELRAADFGVAEVSLSPWPAGHIAGVLSILRLYFDGTESVLMDAWDPVAAAELIERYRVTYSSGTPFHINSLLDAANRESRDISSMREYMLGATAVPPELVNRCERIGITTYRAYGSSEHPTISSGSIDDPANKRAFTDGAVCRGCRVRIVDEEGRELPVGEQGEIVTQGPDQFIGYHQEEMNQSAFLPGGWFCTGDMGRLDEAGFLTIMDRKKDIIIRGGENISSKEVQDYLASHPDVIEAAVVAAPDERLGEKVCAFLLLKDGADLTLQDVQAHFLALKVARQKTPEQIVIVQELPRTSSGKVKKFELRAQLRERSG